MDQQKAKKWINCGWIFAIVALIFCIPAALLPLLFSLVDMSGLIDCIDMGPQYAKILPLNHFDSTIASFFLGEDATYAAKKIFSLFVNAVIHQLKSGLLLISCLSAVAFLCHYDKKRKADWLVGMVSSLLAMQLIPAILFVLAGISRKKGLQLIT